jgi:hypothetical protein
MYLDVCVDENKLLRGLKFCRSRYHVDILRYVHDRLLKADVDPSIIAKIINIESWLMLEDA